MTNLIAYFLFGVLIFLFFNVLKKSYVEHYTKKKNTKDDIENYGEDEDNDSDDYDEDNDVDDENEDNDVDDENKDNDLYNYDTDTDNNDESDVNYEKSSKFDLSNANSKENYTPVHINNSNISDTIILKDSIRRDSKISSSLNYTYIDENCTNTKNIEPEIKSVENLSTQPTTPIVTVNSSLKKQNPSWNDSKCNKSGPNHTNYYQKNLNNDKNFYSEIFDDSDLKPKPNIESPYGFVYFPNKYWKQWQSKSKVCTPVSGGCKVLPTYTEGTPVDVLDYTQVGSMMPKFEYLEEYESK